MQAACYRGQRDRDQGAVELQQRGGGGARRELSPRVCGQPLAGLAIRPPGVRGESSGSMFGGCERSRGSASERVALDVLIEGLL